MKHSSLLQLMSEMKSSSEGTNRDLSNPTHPTCLYSVEHHFTPRSRMYRDPIARFIVPTFSPNFASMSLVFSEKNSFDRQSTDLNKILFYQKSFKSYKKNLDFFPADFCSKKNLRCHSTKLYKMHKETPCTDLTSYVCTLIVKAKMVRPKELLVCLAAPK